MFQFYRDLNRKSNQIKNCKAKIELLGSYDPQNQLIIEDPYYVSTPLVSVRFWRVAAVGMSLCACPATCSSRRRFSRGHFVTQVLSFFSPPVLSGERVRLRDCLPAVCEVLQSLPGEGPLMPRLFSPQPPVGPAARAVRPQLFLQLTLCVLPYIIVDGNQLLYLTDK